MLTSTAGEVSTAVASAAPVARARMLEAVAAASARARHAGTLSFPAATRWAPRRKTVPNMSHLLFAQPDCGACNNRYEYIDEDALGRKERDLHIATRACEHRLALAHKRPWRGEDGRRMHRHTWPDKGHKDGLGTCGHGKVGDRQRRAHSNGHCRAAPTLR